MKSKFNELYNFKMIFIDKKQLFFNRFCCYFYFFVLIVSDFSCIC